MIRLAVRFAVAEARRAPGRFVAVAVLLAAAALLPAALDAPWLVAMLVAVAAAFAATVGSVELAEQRIAVLARNGAARGIEAGIASISMLLVGAPAFVAAWIVAAACDVAMRLGSAALVTVAIPVVTAPIAAWLARRSALPEGVPATGPTRRRRVVAIVTFVVVCLVFVPLGFTLLAGWLASGVWSKNRLRMLIASGVALLSLGLAVCIIGSSNSWWGLGFALLCMIPVLAVAVAILAVHAHSVVATLVGGFGPRVRLALAPLTLRRRVLAPLLALVTLSMTLAVTEGVVGASFGRREADRATTMPTITARAGSDASQAIAPIAPVDPNALRRMLHEQLAGTNASAVVIDQVGAGNTTSVLPSAARGQRSVILALTGGMSDLPGIELPGGGPNDPTARWVGVVDPGNPDGLKLLGLSGAAGPLADGKVVLTAKVEPWTDGKVALKVGNSSVRRDAAVSSGPRGGYALPGAIVSAAVAAELSPLLVPARVVVVPKPGAATRPTVTQLVRYGQQIQRASARLPVAHPDGLTATQQSNLELYAQLVAPAVNGDTVVSGAEHVTIWKSGPLNDVPFFASTEHDARRAAPSLVVLSVLVTLAVVFLALGATRRDDEILEVQGAPAGLRSVVAAIQAAVVTLSAVVLAALLGIAVPAASFAIYNKGSDLPAIPLVLPGLVWIVLVIVPVCTSALAAFLPIVRRNGVRATSIGGAFDNVGWSNG